MKPIKSNRKWLKKGRVLAWVLSNKKWVNYGQKKVLDWWDQHSLKCNGLDCFSIGVEKVPGHGRTLSTTGFDGARSRESLAASTSNLVAVRHSNRSEIVDMGAGQKKRRSTTARFREEDGAIAKKLTGNRSIRRPSEFVEGASISSRHRTKETLHQCCN